MGIGELGETDWLLNLTCFHKGSFLVPGGIVGTHCGGQRLRLFGLVASSCGESIGWRVKTWVLALGLLCDETQNRLTSVSAV